MSDLQAGLYRHYKGPLYMVLGVGHDSNADSLGNRAEVSPNGYSARVIPLGDRPVVVYIALNIDKSGPPMAVRSLDDFNSLVHTDGSRCEGDVCSRQYDGSMSRCDLRRFTYIGVDRP